MSIQQPTYIKVTGSYVFMPHSCPCSSNEKHKKLRVDNYREVIREKSNSEFTLLFSLTLR